MNDISTSAKMLKTRAKIFRDQYGATPADSASLIAIEIEVGQAEHNYVGRLVLCVDTSGSMSGKPIEMVKNTLKAIIGMRRDKKFHFDLSIITFSTTAQMIEYSSYDDLITKVDLIVANGQTNLSDALGMAHTAFNREKYWLAILTDGEPNHGRYQIPRDITIFKSTMNNCIMQAFGYGSYDIDVLKALSDTYQHIDNIEKVPMIFAAYLGEVTSTVGTNLDIAFPVFHPSEQSEAMTIAGILPCPVLVEDVTYRILHLPFGKKDIDEIRSFAGKYLTIIYTDLMGEKHTFPLLVEENASKDELPIEFKLAYYKSSTGRMLENLMSETSKFSTKERIAAVKNKIADWPDFAYEYANEIKRTIENMEKGHRDLYLTSAGISSAKQDVSYTSIGLMTPKQASTQQAMSVYTRTEGEDSGPIYG